MRSEPPPELEARIRSWETLSRWEKAEVGRDLRRLGWTYTEIRQVIPVPKATLAGWCRDIRLTPQQVDAIRQRRPPGVRTGIPVDTQRSRRTQIQRIRMEAKAQAVKSISNPLWLAGTVLYWAEGSKTKTMLQLSNSDPSALRLFCRWCSEFHQAEPSFSLALHLHQGNDESAAKEWWASQLALDSFHFTKTFTKPAGTGHRKNHLKWGICRVTLQKSADAFHRTMAWIDAVAELLGRRA